MILNDLDLTAYDKDVVQHVLLGRARARMMEDVRGTRDWDVDLARGELRIGRATFGVQLLGTYSHTSATFLWGWANSSARDWSASLEVARELRQRGNLPGQAVYVEAKVAAEWVNPNELAYVSGELAGSLVRGRKKSPAGGTSEGLPVFVGAYDGGAAFLLVTTMALDPAQISLAYLPGIFVELPEFTGMDPRTCIRTFAERIGFRVQESDRFMQCARRDGRRHVRRRRSDRPGHALGVIEPI